MAQTHWSYRARIVGTRKGKRKGTFEVPQLFISEYKGSPSPFDAERATKEAADFARAHYRIDKPLSAGWQVTALEITERDTVTGYQSKIEDLHPAYTHTILFLGV